jgi:hypothetical protein
MDKDKIGINFGQLIAYLAPGFVALYGLAGLSTSIAALLRGNPQTPEAAASIPLILLALGAGIVVNAVAWALVRPLISLTGVRRPKELANHA